MALAETNPKFSSLNKKGQLQGLGHLPPVRPPSSDPSQSACAVTKLIFVLWKGSHFKVPMFTAECELSYLKHFI